MYDLLKVGFAGFLAFFSMPTALGQVPLPLDRVSSGALLRLDQKGNLVRAPRPKVKTTADEGLAAGLDPRVGPNVRLGDDPAALPATMRAQAEPHVVRDVANPDFLVATFQEGRYASGGGAVDCGYSVSTNGGLTWTRALIPLLTQVVGGTYYRATDPVAGIDLKGNIFLNTLGSIDNEFGRSALLVSRSTNAGLTFESPVEITRSPDPTILVDKNWMAINAFSNTPTANRIVSTFTRFEALGYPICLTYSDDQGQTWTPYQYLMPNRMQVQGSQPVFLPSGRLAVAYWNFAPEEPIYEFIEVLVSTNGGDNFTFSNRVAQVRRYDAPGIRDGTFLISAIGNRVDDSIYVTYQATHNGSPRIMFTRTWNAGTNWTTPVPVSDNPGTAVFNPVVAASPDGQTVSIIFYDARLNPNDDYLVDIYLAQSLDGGTNWLPNLRVTSRTSDVQLSPYTGSGYMVGDYQGLAPAEPPNIPAVPLFIDTRTGSPDPFVARIGASSNVTFTTWSAARFSNTQIITGAGDPGADPDADSVPNALEYAFGLNPLTVDAPRFAMSSRPQTNHTASAVYERLANASDLRFAWLDSTNFVQWTLATNLVQTTGPGANPQFLRTATIFDLDPAQPGRFFRLAVELQNPPP